MDDRVVYIIFNAIFSVDIAYEVERNAKILRKLLEKFGIKDSQKELILNLEHFLLVKNKNEDFESFVGTILMGFY